MKKSKDSLTIRQAHPDEAGCISRLALRSKGYWGYDADFLRQCEMELTYTPDQLDSAEHYFAVAQKQASIVGFYALNFSNESKIELTALFIEPHFIGQGIGEMLLNHAINCLKQRGSEKLHIQSDPNAADFYLRNGGKLIGQLASGSISGRTLPLFEIKIS